MYAPIGDKLISTVSSVPPQPIITTSSPIPSEQQLPHTSPTSEPIVQVI